MPPTVNKQTFSKPKPTGGVLSRIGPLGENASPGIKCLLYGQSGTGKTTLWATFPDPILAVVCSGGLTAGELRSVDTPENKGRIKQVVIERSSEVAEVAGAAVEMGFRTLVLDHATGLQDLILKEILGLDEIPAQRPILGDNKRTWGEVANQGKQALRSLLNARCNVVVIAQERTFGFEEDTVSDVIRPTVGAALTPSLTGWLNPACDYVLQCFKRPRMNTIRTMVGKQEMVSQERGVGVEYCLRCEPHDIIMTKFRTPKGVKTPIIVTGDSVNGVDKRMSGYEKIMAVIRGEEV